MGSPIFPSGCEGKLGVALVLGKYQFSSVAQWCLTLCDPMNQSTLGLPVLHQLLELPQTHVHQVSDAFQPSHPLSSPSPPAPNPSQWALRARASVSVAPRLWSTGSVVVAHRLSCSKVCGIFPDQEWNPCGGRGSLSFLRVCPAADGLTIRVHVSSLGSHVQLPLPPRHPGAMGL